jgi:diguanylate cyclase (GGDEF)-like protein
MSIRYKFFFAFSILVALACFLALVGFQGIAMSGDLVVRLYDGPLMGINHARSADSTLGEARVLLTPDRGSGSRDDTVIKKFQAMVAEIAQDLKIVHDRIEDDDVKAALAKAEGRIRDWSDAELELLNSPPDGVAKVPTALAVWQKADDAATALDGLVERVTAYGFEYRKKAEAAVAAARTTLLVLAIGTILVGIMLAIGFSWSMSRPISEAMQVAERVASGNFTDQIVSDRQDELGRLQRSLAAMQSGLKTRADQDYAAMEKLDAALNNMTQGLCMFGPDDRLMLWNERYVTMYRIAPGRLFVGCTLEAMLEARKDAGTAYKDLAQYEAKLQLAITTRSPDSLIAELADGRIVSVAYRATQSGSWVSTHQDITERMQDQARIAHLAFHDQLTGLPNRAAFNDHIAKLFDRASAENENFAVLCLDLDRFKEINDVYGHSTGDRFIAEIGRRLALACEAAFLARLGGDEFTIVLPGATQPAEALCERLSSILDVPVQIDEYQIPGSFTIGASLSAGRRQRRHPGRERGSRPLSCQSRAAGNDPFL